MNIRITRATVVKPLGQMVQAANPGDIVDVEEAQALQLIALGKAVATMPAPAVTTEAALIPTQTRSLPRRKTR